MTSVTDNDKTYNGWANYETWCVNLWLSNDEGLYGQVYEMLRPPEAVPGESYGEIANEQAAIADQLKSFVDELAEQTCPGSREGASFVTDLLSAALSEVDWYEIVSSWREG